MQTLIIQSVFFVFLINSSFLCAAQPEEQIVDLKECPDFELNYRIFDVYALENGYWKQRLNCINIIV